MVLNEVTTAKIIFFFKSVNLLTTQQRQQQQLQNNNNIHRVKLFLSTAIDWCTNLITQTVIFVNYLRVIRPPSRKNKQLETI